MTKIEINHLDPWLKQAVDDRAIDTATFVGRYGVDVGIDVISAAVFLTRAPPGRWELWAVSAVTESDMDEVLRRHAAHDASWRVLALSRGLAAAGVGEAADRDAAKYLFDRLQRATIHNSWPCEPFGGGLLSAKELAHVVAEIGAELEHNRQAALAASLDNTIPIIATARELKLDPRPAGQNKDAWMASCPSGRQHWIMISASSNEFGCGYCRRKGGPDELRRFYEASLEPQIDPRGRRLKPARPPSRGP